MRRLVAVLATFATLFCARAATAPAPLTAEELFRPAALQQADLSPDGSRFAAITTDDEEVRHLLVVDLKTSKPTGVRADDEFDISNFYWLGRDRLLYGVRKDKLIAWGLYAADFEHLNRGRAIDTGNAIYVIGTPETRPGHVIIWVAGAASDNVTEGALVELDANRPQKKRLNFYSNSVNDGAITHRFPTPKPGNIVNWFTRPDGELGLVETFAAGRIHLLRLIREGEQESWREVSLDWERHTPMALDPDGHSLWLVAHTPEAGNELRRLNLDTGELGASVHTDVAYDFSGGRLHFSERTGSLAGLSYLQRKPVTVWFSKDYAALQATVDQLSPATANVLFGHDRAEKKFLFQLSAPQRPAAYVILDLDRHSTEQVADAAPWLAGRPFVPVQPVSYRTRDGVKLEGYLALPSGASEQHPVPLIVLAHSPWERASPTFDPAVQFYASRGYAVFQPNFRGSPGFSPAVSRGHDFDFGLMHRDLTDGVRAMLRSGFVDPQRVAIVSNLFGEYLALSGVAFEPGLYRCAITVGGYFDPQRMAESLRDKAIGLEFEKLTAHLAQPDFTREGFAPVSPLAHADQIRVPMLLADGTGRFALDDSQTKRLVATLKKQGTPHETFLRKFQGEAFFKYQDRVDFYHRVEAFLALHLGGASLSGSK